MQKTNYFTIEVFGAHARTCAQYLAKGSRVVVDAEPDWREWTDQQGTRREAVTFTARQVLFEGARPEPAPTSNGATQAPDAAAPPPPPAAAQAPPAVAPTPAAAIAAGAASAEDLPF